MIDIIIIGSNGYMGKVLTAITADDPEIKITAGIDVKEDIDTEKSAGYPVFRKLADIPLPAGGDNGKPPDVIIDFSHPSALDDLLEYGKKTKTPVILCATGYTPEQIAAIEKTAEFIPVFRSGNMSLGINLLIDLIKRASAVLGETFDVEIIERHHRRKLDAPSGTAVMLADAANSALPYDAKYVYERESRRQPRGADEIGISAVRGGTVVGVHEVIFAGLDEVVELKHTASSRDIFAAGALKAAKFMAGKKSGLYDMRDVLAGN